MRPQEYIKTFQGIGSVIPIWNSVFLILKQLHDQNGDKLAQQSVNMVIGSHTLIEDGIIGPSTIKHIAMVDPVKFLSALGTLLTKKKQAIGPKENDLSVQDSVKEAIMTYLGKNEGTHMHWNSTERNFTTAYGVYAYSFPKSKPVKYMQSIAKKKGFGKITRHNVRKVDRAMTTGERRALKDIVYAFYLTHFMDPKVNEHLGIKSSRSFFSISVNGGMGRGYKSLQSAIGTKVDGKFGKGSFKKLESCTKSDTALNQSMLTYMAKFYARLVKKAKFWVYRRGWKNRLLGLGWVVNVKIY